MGWEVGGCRGMKKGRSFITVDFDGWTGMYF